MRRVFSHPGSRQQSGVALIIVLAFLVVLTGILIAFFSSVTNELDGARGFAANASTRQLAESANSLVIAQIANGTAGWVDPSTPGTRPLGWASQPGMIRTYEETGVPYRYYKLYSAQNMVIRNAGADDFSVLDEFKSDVPANWAQSPAAYVDLNAPVKTVVPNSTIPSPTPFYNYPIVDPTAQRTTATSNDGIEGFEILTPPGFSGATTKPGVKDNPTSGPNANPAAMPVRWLYTLQDGTVIPAPDAGVGTALDWSAVTDAKARPTKLNPIVGRIAFWADDDTSKININTASEGTFWDRPWSKSAVDTTLATNMPGQGEYSRYPGHTAMTCLSPVLGFIMPFTGYPALQRYYLLVPRTMYGGSQAGTTAPSATTGLGSDNERLFASVDELLYVPSPYAGNERTPFNDLPAARAREIFEKAKFFLTANCRAPEVNMFNKPRVSLWPLQVSTAERNAKDNLIAFCSTTAGGNYFFQRLNKYSGDGRGSITSPMPSSQSPEADFTQIKRNRDLYGYLQTLTDAAHPVPGFGGSFKQKYDSGTGTTTERDQILTEMYDYIRTNVNAYNTSLAPFYDYAPTRNGGPVAGETQLVPAINRTNDTKGFGRFATVTEAAIVFHRQSVPGSGDRLKAALILELFNPTPGLASWSPNVRYVIRGLDGIDPSGSGATDQFTMSSPAFAVPGPQKMGWPEATAANPFPFINRVTSRVGYSGGGHAMSFMGAFASFRYFASGGTDSPKFLGTGATEQEYPYYTPNGILLNPAIPTPAPVINFKGGEIRIEIYSGYETAKVPPGPPRPELLVQTLHLKFPDFNALPLPSIATAGDFAARIAVGSGSLIQNGDVVRSVEIRPDGPARGDLRCVAGITDVPKDMFVPHISYLTSTPMAHSLRSEETYFGSAQGPTLTTLVAGLGYNRTPAVARGVTSALMNPSNLPGDFDNATGDGEDGAYVNKADEGNLKTDTTGGYFGRGSFAVEDGRTQSPNRQIASAVSFGSLPTGIKATQGAVISGQAQNGRPWQTLLFCPNPSGKSAGQRYDAAALKHAGFGTAKSGASNPSGAFNQPPYVLPPDHLFLDLFTMPIVEPYAISEPFSTAGKVNLNYQIAPFNYILRSTAMRAVLRSTKIMAIPSSSTDKSASQRYDINADVGSGVGGIKLDQSSKGTLFGFDDRFNGRSHFKGGDLFRSASQICDISLVPQAPGVNYESMDSFWAQNKRTGDNVREFPYGHIYPRVTTKSNTFTVHVRVQSLKQSPNTDPAKWDEKRDKVLSEYRGSTTIERYIDVASAGIPDYALASTNSDLSPLYRFRVLNSKPFNP